VNLVDWFAVALFTALGIFIWLYWTALNFGFPSALAQRVAILAPGVQGNANLYEVLTGVFASMAWVVLVIWRLRRGNPRLWRPVVLSAGGLTLLWVLLMTLWLPAIDRIQGQQTLAQSLESAWIQSAQTKPKALQANTSRFCVQLTHESQTLDAIAIALTHLPVRRDPQCHWRLGSRAPNATELREWKTIWRSSGTEDRRIRERFVLLERQSQ
jgi:4-amino-4-deoxy-L-arabinose transferase-like glycosyltransferase